MKPYPLSRSVRLLLVAACLAAVAAGPHNVLIVVNDQSLDSLELGQYYRSARNIAEVNVCHISVPPAVQGFPATYNISASEFASSIRAPILAHIADNGLDQQVDYIVFSRDIPYRVEDNNGITAAMFYGYRDLPAFPLPAGARSDYYGSERAFSRQSITNDYYLSMMLTGWTQQEAKDMIDRGVAADGTFPDASAYLVKSTDQYRNVRHVQFDNTDFLCRFTTSPTATVVNALSIMGRTDVIGYLASSAGVPNLQLNTYFPGAIGDHMTSLGGYLFESSGQMSILEFIKYGLTGTYGTVIEPYNYREKFPHAMAHWWIARGFTLADSYWMSVQHPYMGLFVGEPLAAPYASSPTVNITSPTNGSVISGLELLTITAAATLDPVAVIDVFVDDVFLATVTNEAPSPGNVVTATISGTDVSYTVMTNDTLEDVAVGLAAAISAAPGLPVDALATPDRVMLVYTNYGATGSHIDYSVSCSTGTAPVLSLHATALSSNLLETLYQARELLYVSADAPDAGDKLRLVITLESALSFTNEVTASGGETASDLLSSLFAAVNSDTNLQNADGVYAADFVTVGDAEFWLRARTAGPQGYNIAVDFAIEGTGLDTNYAFADQFNDNAGDMTARGQILLAEGLSNLVSSYTFDTTAYADGPHRLTAIAYDGSARQTQGAAELAVVVSNSALSCVLSEPTNNYATTLGSSVTTRVAVAGAVGTVTQVTFFVEGKPIGSDTTAPFELSWQTLGYGVGSVEVKAQALDDAGPSAVSAPAAVLITSSSDADQDALPDTWERTYFGGIYPQAGTNDADGDAAANWEEYVAGTVPTNDASVFEIVTASNISDTNAVIQWSSVAGKTYAVDGGSNLTAGLSAIVSNLPATPPQNSYTNTSGVFPAFFRIRVE